MYKVVIVEDHKIVAQGVKALLMGSSYKILEIVDSYKTLLEILDKESEIHIILLDIRLGGDSGIFIAKQIKKEYPTIKIIGLSSSIDVQTLTQCTKVGMDGFVSKSSSNLELLTALDAVMDHKNYYSSDIKKQIQQIKEDLSIHPELFKNHQLSDREIEIVRLFAEGNSYKEIASLLCISTSTVDSHKYKIFEKLGVNNTVDIIKYAIKNNLIEL